MIFWKYFSFISLVAFRKISIYLTTLLYLVFLVLITYLIPEILGKEIIAIYASETILGILVMLLVITSSTIAIQIFKMGEDNGLDLLLASKPINKNLLLLAKYSVTNLIYLIIAALSLFVVAFTPFSNFNETGISESLCIATFVATLLISFVWGSVTIIFSSFLSKLTTLVSVIGIEMLLLLTSIVIYFAVPTSNSYLANNNIEVKPLGLVYKTKEGLEYHNYGYAYLSKQPVTSDSKFQGVPLENYGVSPSDFLNFAWNNGKKYVHSNVTNALNLESQFASMYRYYNNKALSSMDLSPKLNDISHKGNKFTDWDLKFGKNNNQILNDPNLISFDNYVLGLNNGAEIYSDFNYLKDINTISYSDYGLLSPNLYAKEIKLPIYKFDENKQWVVKEFDNIDTFAKTYYSSEMINYSQAFMKNLKANNYDKNLVSEASLYSSIFMSYVYKKLGVVSLSDRKLGTELIKDYSKLIFQFQYWTYLTLEQIYTHNMENQIDKLTLYTMFRVLNSNINAPNDYNIQMYAMVDNPIKISSNDKVVLKISNPLSITPKQNLESITYIQTSIEYDYLSLYLVWFFVGLTLCFTGMTILSKKDIK